MSKELSLCHKFSFVKPISSTLWYFKLTLFDLTAFIVWNIKDLRHWVDIEIRESEFVSKCEFLLVRCMQRRPPPDRRTHSRGNTIYMSVYHLKAKLSQGITIAYIILQLICQRYNLRCRRWRSLGYIYSAQKV